ncbi:hypothetical protein VTK73DRAFT_1249 [Phialemonium thermophilum]|uniref:BON domain-containing protein n=1 Tax=Phialemonium thermophilum TaxID=223376 RepID=A0ABR3Y3B2_9PEZI
MTATLLPATAVGRETEPEQIGRARLCDDVQGVGMETKITVAGETNPVRELEVVRKMLLTRDPVEVTMVASALRLVRTPANQANKTQPSLPKFKHNQKQRRRQSVCASFKRGKNDTP